MGGEIIRPPAIVDTTPLAIRESREIGPLLDRVAAGLTEQGFDVSRVPFLFRYPDVGTEILAGEKIPSRPWYPVLTYNNLLLETGDGEPLVLLPRYGWPALDRAGAEAWRTLGFAVEPIPGFAISAMYGGALRCSVKVLARG